MPLKPVDLYSRASAWTNEKISVAATQLDARTPCDEWDVRTLLNHMLQTQRYFLGAARGEDAPPPSPTPPRLITDDPAADFAQARDQMLRAYGEPGVLDKTGPALGIAFSDQLLHGWDLALHGRFTDDQRKGTFKPEITVPAGGGRGPRSSQQPAPGRRPWTQARSTRQRRSVHLAPSARDLCGSRYSRWRPYRIPVRPGPCNDVRLVRSSPICASHPASTVLGQRFAWPRHAGHPAAT